MKKHTPDKRNTYVLGFSGGKDSVATWLYLTKVLGLNVICVFADTGHEAEILYEYLDELERDHGLVLVRICPTLGQFVDGKEMAAWKACSRLGLVEGITGDELREFDELQRKTRKGWKVLNEAAKSVFELHEPEGWRDVRINMERLAILKRRFPSTSRRFCTTFLKLMPQLHWLNEWKRTLDPDSFTRVIRCSGVRAQESSARAKHAEFAHDDYMDCWMWLPIHKWSHEEVFAIHDKYGISPNPLYKLGCGRVGCYPCINSTKPEIGSLARNTDALIQLKGMEERVSESVGAKYLSFFSPNKTPDRFHSEWCDQSGKSFPTAEDVGKWATADDPDPNQKSLFEEDEHEDSHTCSSIYGLCE